MPELREVSALITDYDDTLMATTKRVKPAIIRAFRELGLDVSLARFDSLWGKPFESLVREIAKGIDYEGFLAHLVEMLGDIAPELLPGAEEMLAAASRQGIPIYIVSMGSRRIVEPDLEASDLHHYITKMWCAEDLAHRKPDPRVLLPLLSELEREGLDPSRACYVGDSVVDHTVACSHGIEFFGVLSGLAEGKDFLCAGVAEDRLLNSLESITLRSGGILETSSMEAL